MNFDGVAFRGGGGTVLFDIAFNLSGIFAVCRLPLAVSRLPLAAGRWPLAADRRPPTADCRLILFSHKNNQIAEFHISNAKCTIL
jgi:hypothetical protein